MNLMCGIVAHAQRMSSDENKLIDTFQYCSSFFSHFWLLSTSSQDDVSDHEATRLVPARKKNLVQLESHVIFFFLKK